MTGWLSEFSGLIAQGVSWTRDQFRRGEWGCVRECGVLGAQPQLHRRRNVEALKISLFVNLGAVMAGIGLFALVLAMGGR
jgi:hypothetical protein